MSFRSDLRAARAAGCRYKQNKDGRLGECRVHTRGLKCPHCGTAWACGELWPDYLRYPGATCNDYGHCRGKLQISLDSEDGEA